MPRYWNELTVVKVKYVVFAPDSLLKDDLML